MAYARFGLGSDIYLVSTIRGYVCYCCKLKEEKCENSVLKNLSETRLHILEHFNAGHKVEKHTIDRINKELEEL